MPQGDICQYTNHLLSGDFYIDRGGRLIALQRASGNSVTLDLRDEAGFLVLPVEIPLSVAATRMLDDEGETSGFMYEGSESLGFDSIRVVSLLDFRWRF